MKIYLKVKNVCGTKALYPNCERSLLLLKLARREKIFQAIDLPVLKAIGFELEITGDPSIVNMLTY